jgi:hypothetical protein
MLNNHGSVEVASGTLALTGGIDQSEGTTRLAGGNLQGGLSDGFTMMGGTLTGAGKILGNVDIWHGTLALETPPGQRLEVQGNLTLHSDSVSCVAAKSTTTEDVSRLVVSGNATLGGALRFSTAAGFTPPWLARFPVIAAANVTGVFDSCSFSTAPAHTRYEPSYGTQLAEVVVVPQAFLGWQFVHFGTSTDLARIGEAADPDGDGMANLLEYALGLDPLTPDAAGGPTVSIQEDPNNRLRYLRMTYRQSVSATGVELTPESSRDLVTWNSGEMYIATRSDTTLKDVRTVTVELITPVDYVARAFFRLRANRTE